MSNESGRVNQLPSLAAADGNFTEHDEISLRRAFDFLRAGRWTIVFVALTVVVLGALYSVLANPIYKADGLVEVEEDSKSGSLSQMSDISSLLLGTPVETEAEIQILSSRMILNQVIDKMNMLIQAEPKYFPVIGRAINRFNRRAPGPIKVFSLLRGYAWGGEKIELGSFEVPDTELGKIFVLTRTAAGYTLKDPDGEVVLSGKIGERAEANAASGHFAIFVSDLIAEPDTQFKLIRYTRQAVLEQLLKRLDVAEQGKQSGVIQVSFEGSTASLVTHVVDNILDAYLRQNVERRSEDAQQSLIFLEKQLPQLKAQVDAAQAGLNEYQLKHGSVDVAKETELVLEQGVALDTQRLDLQQQRDEALQRFTPEHPVIKALNDQIQTLAAAQGTLKQQFEKLPNQQQDIAGLLRDVDVTTQLYTQLLNSIQELQIAKAGTIGNVRIVDHALKPTKPKWPNFPVVLALALLLGTPLGAAVIFIQRALLRGVDDPKEVESRFGLVTYAMIPYSRAQYRLNQDMIRGGGGNFILALREGSDVAIEALRSLRTSLHFAMLESPNNVVMLTGPAPSLGKSFVSINLAALLALSGKKVVLVDADLRMGYIHRFISAEASPGVADYVIGEASLKAIEQATSIEGLTVIAHGTPPPNPSELLLHERFSELIRTLSSTHDYVILDTPPVLAVADASIAGRLAGCTLLVLKSAFHPMREIEETIKRLNSAGIHVRGTLFNQVGVKAGSYGYGNYGYTYYNYDQKS